MPDQTENPPPEPDAPLPDQHEAASVDELPAADPRRRTRLRQLAAAIVTVVAALTVIVVTAGGSSAPPEPGSKQAHSAARQISTLLRGIPQHYNTLGQPTAAVTLKWYGDLECPYCKEFTLGALPSIITRWVRGGKLKIEYLSMETATREPKVFETQQIAALAAGLQNKMWNYIETFYHEQGEEDSGYVTEGYLQGLAGQIPGLDVALWREDRYDPQLMGQVSAERQAAHRAGYPGTPTFLIGHSNGQLDKLAPYSLAQTGSFDEAVQLALQH